MKIGSFFTMCNYFTVSFSSFPVLTISFLVAKQLVGIIISSFILLYRFNLSTASALVSTRLTKKTNSSATTFMPSAT